ncbi:hypothetical protein Q1695_005444 [Nippostrongylus brasiliensis]|nr:hypothetical protein Q1695_005444 [Nippostrongylus brasiliensis]
MTINYNRAVSTSKPWTFFRLLFKWKGSIWKAVYLELLGFLVIYGTISAIYRCALNKSQQKNFEAVVRFFDARLSYIPLELVLGFFCTQVFNRWNKQYDSIGFIDNIGLMTALYVRGRSERARIYRRNILRYCELVQVMVFRDVSMRVRRRFPTLDTIVAAGFMLPHEKEAFESYTDSDHSPKYWIPANWALAMTYNAWKHGHIESDYYKVTLQEEIKKWRSNLEWVFNYDWVPLPLMYPQVVCLAVHLYFLVCILSRQQIIVEHEFKTEIDTYFPIMTALQFVFYMGWMKVIEAVINPFGEDDDDFETNALIDRNITMGMMMVDKGYNRPPEVRRDPFWDEIHPLYSEATSRTRNNPPRGSVSHVKLGRSVTEVIMVPHSRPNDRSAPVLTSGASIRKSARVKVKDDERNQPRQQSNPELIQRIKSTLSKIYQRILSMLRSIIPNSSSKKNFYPAKHKVVEKPPPLKLSNQIITSANCPVSIAIPTQSPSFNEKFVE